jgi:hypothetical protein
MRRRVERNRMIDDADRSHAFDAHVLGNRYAGGAIGIDADDQNIGLLGRKPQQPEVTGMNDVEIARDEGDGSAIAAT